MLLQKHVLHTRIKFENEISTDSPWQYITTLSMTNSMTWICRFFIVTIDSLKTTKERLGAPA